MRLTVQQGDLGGKYLLSIKVLSVSVVSRDIAQIVQLEIDVALRLYGM